jgi:type II secretory pathway component PulF
VTVRGAPSNNLSTPKTDGALSALQSRFRGAIGGDHKQKVLFARQMSMLMGVGTGVVPALGAIVKQVTDERWRKGMLHVRDEVEQGAPLAAAMAREPDLFNQVFCSMVAAGEATATLPATFSRLSDLAKQQWETRNRVVGAAIYPVVLICICLGVISILVLFVLPRFETLFETIHVDLPVTTAKLMVLSRFIKSYGLEVGGAVASAIVAVAVYLRSRSGQQMVDWVSLRVPLLGHLIKSLIVARTCRLLGVMLAARVSLLESVELTLSATRHSDFRRLLEKLKQDVTEGRPLAESMESSSLIDPAIVQAIAAGEESGNLGMALTFVADWLDEENRSTIAALSKVFEPLVLVVMGVVVGGVAISLFLPLFDMAAATAG